MVIKAHLNSGPYDDQYMVVPQMSLYIAGYRNDIHISNLAGEEVGIAPSIKEGLYCARLDSNRELVPHNLDGVAEFDWHGWQ